MHPSPAIRILIVDDDADISASLGRRLRLKGYEVFSASSGEQALKLLQKTEVDVVITDLRMPGAISGETLCNEISLLSKHPRKLVLMSGYPDELCEAARKVPNIIKLPKPFVMHDLLQLIA